MLNFWNVFQPENHRQQTVFLRPNEIFVKGFVYENHSFLPNTAHDEGDVQDLALFKTLKRLQCKVRGAHRRGKGLKQIQKRINVGHNVAFGLNGAGQDFFPSQLHHARFVRGFSATTVLGHYFGERWKFITGAKGQPDGKRLHDGFAEQTF